eukprot:scaffold21977_cov32-Tisochrysis_lutea.AAC.3
MSCSQSAPQRSAPSRSTMLSSCSAPGIAPQREEERQSGGTARTACSAAGLQEEEERQEEGRLPPTCAQTSASEAVPCSLHASTAARASGGKASRTR